VRQQIGFGSGLNTLSEAYAIADGEVADILDVSIHKPGSVSTRGGFKRGNRTAASGAVLGIYEFTNGAGTTKYLAKIGTSLHTFTVDSSNVITVGAAIKTGLASGFKPFFATMDDNAVIFDKTANYMYNGTNITELGRDKPSNAGIILVNGGAGSLDVDGVYSYKLAFYSTTLGIEGTLSDLKTHTITGGQSAITVTLTAAVTGQLDSVWDKIRVYRTVGGGTALFLHPDTQTATFTDTTSDAGLTATVASDTGFVKLPGARCGVEYLGRLWAVKDSDPTFVYYTSPGEPGKWSEAQTIRVGRKDGFGVLGFIKTHGRLYAIKRDSLWLLVGDDPAAMLWQEFEGGQGGESGRATVVNGGLTYVFNARVGIYRFLGAGVERIGSRIRDTVLDLDIANDAQNQYVAEYEPLSESIWFAVRTAAGIENDRVLVYFVRTGAWSVYDLNVSAMANVHDGTGFLRAIFGDDDGHLNWIGEYNSDGEPGGTISGVIDDDDGSILADSDAAFNQTGSKLAKLKLTVMKADFSAWESVDIVTNTGTNIEHAAFSSITPDTNDLYFVGAVRFYVKSKSVDMGAPTSLKRAPYLNIAYAGQTTTRRVIVRDVQDGTAGTYQTDTVNDKQATELSLMSGGSGGAAIRFQLEINHIDNAAKLTLQGADIEAEVVDQR
jgi:hypothetical protein